MNMELRTRFKESYKGRERGPSFYFIPLSAGIICVCWVAGTLVGFLPLLGWNAGHKSDEKCIFTEVMDYDYLVFLYFATIIFPALLIAAFYAHIYRVVIKQVGISSRLYKASIAYGQTPSCLILICSLFAMGGFISPYRSPFCIWLMVSLLWFPIRSIKVIGASIFNYRGNM
jgi:hypothetical protein